MKHIFRLLLCTLSFFSVTAHAANYVISPAGNYTVKQDFTACATAPAVPCTNFTLSQGVSGSFSVSGTLAPNLPGTDISGLLTGFSFNDGINTYVSTDPAVRVYVAYVLTDASGTVTGLQILLERWLSGTSPHVATDRFSYFVVGYGVAFSMNSKIPGTLLESAQKAAQGAPGTSFAQAINNALCGGAGPSPLSGVADTCYSDTPDSSTSTATGALVSLSGGPSIPTLSEWGMLILSMLLVGGAFVAMRRRGV